MTSFLTLKVASDAPECILASGEGNSRLLKRLAGFLRLPLEMGAPDGTPAVVISEDAPSEGQWEPWTGIANFNEGIFWQPDEFRFHFHVPPAKRYPLLPIIRRAFNLAIFRRILFGNSLFIHGTLLHFPDTNEAAVLFGASGMGKSTASERFLSQGGSYLSDDKLILSFTPEGIVAQPTPTWSRFGNREMDIDFSRQVPVKAMMLLLRGEDDEIHPADPAQWQLSLVSSFGNVLEYPCDWLPKAIRRRMMEKSMSRIPDLVSQFGIYNMLGALDGHIFNNLRNFIAR